MRLSDTQRWGLERLAAEREQAARTGGKVKWIGSKDGGPTGTTLGALTDKGLAEVRWTDRPYRRLVGRITDAGVEELQRRLERERQRAEARAVEAEPPSDSAVGLGEIDGGGA